MNRNSEKKQIIRMENVFKRYENGEAKYPALSGINFSAACGEFIAIVGKSGSGKSTFLNLLGGIDSPSEGRVFISGQEIGCMKESELSRFRGRNIGFVFQFFQLMPTLTVLENVIMPMDFVKTLPGAERKSRAMMLLNKVGISNHSGKFPQALSGGEQQRTAISRALANDPQIILADEPTGNLDSKTSEDVFNLLLNLSREGKTIIMVTHNEDLANRCGRIVRISDGRIVEDKIINERERMSV